MPVTMLLRVIFLAILPLGTSASGNTNALNRANLRSGPCDESFPLAPADPDSQYHHRGRLFPWRRERRLVAIRPGDESRKYYETGEYYAPLCPDGNHIDIRKLYECSGTACWEESISQCTYECTWKDGDEPTPKRTVSPTRRPTLYPTQTPTVPFIEIVETENPLLLSLKDLAKMYRMNADVREAIIRYMRDRLKKAIEELPYGLELIDLNSPGRLPGKPHDLPLNVKVKAPSDISDFVLDYIRQIVEDSEQEIVADLMNLDDTGGEAFKNLRLVIDTYDIDNIVERPTISDDIVEGPTTTNPPSKSPSTEPEPVKVIDTTTVNMNAKGERRKVPWWVWMIIVLVTILCCICYFFFCDHCRGRDADEKDVQQGQKIDVFMHDQQRVRGDQSLTGSKGTRKSQRTPRSISVSDSDRSRRTTRSTRTYKTRSSRPARSLALAPVSEIPVRKTDAITEASKSSKTWRAIAWDNQTAVSALPVHMGVDPPEEIQTAIVLHNSNRQARDPTFYIDDALNPDKEEPEGDMANGVLMDDVRLEREEGRRMREAKNSRTNTRMDISDPDEEGVEDNQAYYHSERLSLEPEELPEEKLGDGRTFYPSENVLSEPEGLTSDELSAAKKKKKTKRKSHKKKEPSSQSKTSRKSERVRTSTSWKQGQFPTDVQIDTRDSNHDGASFLTSGVEEQHQASSSSRNDDGRHYSNDEGHYHPYSRAPKKGGKEKYRYSDFVREGVSSEDESFHM